MEDTSSQREKPTGLRKKLLFIVGLTVVVAAVLVVKGHRQVSKPSPSGPERRPTESNRMRQPNAENPGSPEQPPADALPRLIDLGADKCIPCKMMAPIIEELKEEYKGVFKVEFIDVWKEPEAGRRWRIRVIPTQIFLDGSGKEIYRHKGFFSKEDILEKWKEVGVDIEPEVGLMHEPEPEIQLAFICACREQPKVRIPGWENDRS